MPLLMTDVAEGQKAALQMQMNPIVAQEEMNRLPLETQRLQQQVIEGQAKQQEMLKSAFEDKTAKEKIQGLYANDPTFNTLPHHEQLAKIGEELTKAGNIKGGLQFYKEAETTELHRWAAKEHELKIAENNAEHARYFVQNMTRDNLEQQILNLQASKKATPQEINALRQVLMSPEAQASDESFARIQGAMVKHMGSVSANLARDTLRVAEAKNTALEKQRDQQHRETMRAREVAAIIAQGGVNARDRMTDISLLNSTERRVKDADDSIEKIDDDIRVLSEAATKDVIPSTGWFSDSEERKAYNKKVAERTAQVKDLQARKIETIKNKTNALADQKSLIERINSGGATPTPTVTGSAVSPPTVVTRQPLPGGGIPFTLTQQEGYEPSDEDQKKIDAVVEQMDRNKSPKAFKLAQKYLDDNNIKFKISGVAQSSAATGAAEPTNAAVISAPSVDEPSFWSKLGKTNSRYGSVASPDISLGSTRPRYISSPTVPKKVVPTPIYDTSHLQGDAGRVAKETAAKVVETAKERVAEQMQVFADLLNNHPEIPEADKALLRKKLEKLGKDYSKLVGG